MKNFNMRARIWFTVFILLQIVLVSGWWWLVDLLPLPVFTKLAIFFLVPAICAFLYPKKAEKP